jgi:hypothetical protein
MNYSTQENSSVSLRKPGHFGPVRSAARRRVSSAFQGGCGYVAPFARAPFPWAVAERFLVDVYGADRLALYQPALSASAISILPIMTPPNPKSAAFLICEMTVSYYQSIE